MSEQGAKPEVLPGDLITGPGLYEARCGDIVRITGWRDGWWVSIWNGFRNHYSSDGRQRYDEGQEPNKWQLLHWVGPLPATEPEPETTTEQLAETSGRDIVQGLVLQVADLIQREEVEIEGQPESTPASEYTPPEGWRVLHVGEELRQGDVRVDDSGACSAVLVTVNGVVPHGRRYIRPIESQPEPQPEPEKLPEGCQNDGGWSNGVNGTEPEPWPVPQPEPEPDAELRIRLLKQCNDNQAETIKRLMAEARDLNMEIGGLERRLSERDDRIRDLETMHAAATQAVVDAGNQNDALRLQVQNRQQEHERQKSRIEFLETLNAGNGAAIDNYRALVAKLQGLVDTARQQLEAAATERDELRAAIDAADKQLDQKDAQIRDLRIELDAAQQVPQPVGDEEREQIWDEATETAGRLVIGWLRPLTGALIKQPDERFCRFMAMTLSILPDILPELLGYAVEDQSLDNDGESE